MRNSLWLACILIGLSASCEATLPSLDSLRCPMSPEVSAPDKPAGNSDTSIFGSTTKDNSYNCLKNPSICGSLGANFSCKPDVGCCEEAILGRCTKSTDCKENFGPVCDLSSNMCVACSTADKTIGDKQCNDWVTTRNDPTNRALCIGGKCLECRSNADCKRTGNAFCDTKSGTCGGCTDNSQCPGSICKATPGLLKTGETIDNVGDCANSADIVYVDKGSASCVSVSGGTMMKPYCEITDALSSGKFYIQILTGRGTGMLYNPVTVSGGQRVAIIGPLGGRDLPLAQQAVINGVTVMGGATVTLEEVVVSNNTGATAAVQCNGLSSIYVQKSIIEPAPAPPNGGIYATNCTVNVEKTKIYRSLGYGLSVTGGGGHRIINNAIINNGFVGSEPFGVRISGITSGLFAFNTIASNKQGVQCDNSVTVSDSIVMSNGTDPQVVGGCSQPRVVTTGVTLAPGYDTMGLDPTLTDPNNLCVDQGLPDSTTAPTIKDDYFSIPRPKGNKYDIGFQEVR